MAKWPDDPNPETDGIPELESPQPHERGDLTDFDLSKIGLPPTEHAPRTRRCREQPARGTRRRDTQAPAEQRPERSARATAFPLRAEAARGGRAVAGAAIRDRNPPEPSGRRKGSNRSPPTGQPRTAAARTDERGPARTSRGHGTPGSGPMSPRRPKREAPEPEPAEPARGEPMPASPHPMSPCQPSRVPDEPDDDDLVASEPWDTPSTAFAGYGAFPDEDETPLPTPRPRRDARSTLRIGARAVAGTVGIGIAAAAIAAATWLPLPHYASTAALDGGHSRRHHAAARLPRTRAAAGGRDRRERERVRDHLGRASGRHGGSPPRAPRARPRSGPPKTPPDSPRRC